jgi:DNA-binding MarR family transcriptional regulator
MQLLSSANKSSGTTCAQEVLEAAPTLVWYIRLHMRKHRQGLSVPQFRALVKVRDVPAVSLSVVADHLGASMPTASRIVGKLVERGLLTRSGCADDRRQVALHLTERGRAVVDAAHEATRAQLESDFAGLSAADRGRVRETMIILKSLFESLGFPGMQVEPGAQEGAASLDETEPADGKAGVLKSAARMRV